MYWYFGLWVNEFTCQNSFILSDMDEYSWGNDCYIFMFMNPSWKNQTIPLQPVANNCILMLVWLGIDACVWELWRLGILENQHCWNFFGLLEFSISRLESPEYLKTFQKTLIYLLIDWPFNVLPATSIPMTIMIPSDFMNYEYV